MLNVIRKFLSKTKQLDAFNSCTLEAVAEADGFCEFKVRLAYTVSFSTDRATFCDTISTNKQTNKIETKQIQTNTPPQKKSKSS